MFYADVTNQNNNEKRQLLILAGKDGTIKRFSGLRVFLPSEQSWVFLWCFENYIPQLVGNYIIHRKKV